MFTLEYGYKKLTLAEDGLSIKSYASELSMSFALDADECRKLAAALLNVAEQKVLRQAVNDWINEAESLLCHLPVDVLMQIYRGESVDTNIDASSFIKEINAPSDMIWTGDKTDFDLLKSCVVHLSREAAQAHADVLNAICRGDIE